MSAAATDREHTDTLSPQGRAALRGGVAGNFVDQVHIFLPLVALAPALPAITGPHGGTAGATIVVMAMLLGRPVGGVVFGRLSDRFGRTRTATVAIGGTATCTLGIAVTPTHEVIGAAAIWWILAMRFLGGVFIAGEYSAAIPLAMEWSRPRLRGLYSGLIMSMAPWAQATIAFTTWALLSLLDPGAYETWGWRVPFVAGGAASVTLLHFYRRQVADRATAAASSRIGLRDLFTGQHRRSFWQLFGLMTGLWIMTNLVVIALPDELRRSVGVDTTTAAWIMGAAAVAQAMVMACTGHLSTLVGRRRFFVLWGLLAAVSGPLVWLELVGTSQIGRAMALACLLQVITVCGYGPVGAYLAEGFPAAIRSTGYGTAYSLSIIVPALHPFWLPQLQHAIGHRTAVVALLVLAGLLVASCGHLGPRDDVRQLDLHPAAKGTAHAHS